MKSNIDWSVIDIVPKTDAEFIECLKSKLWRMNNIYFIKNKNGEIVRFRMNHAQRKVAECSHNRKIILKSRQQGISTYHLIYNLDESLFKDNLSNGILAQDLEAAKTLLTKCAEAWEFLSPDIKKFLELSTDSDNKTEFSFSNNSRLMIKTSFRSGTLQNLHISELGKIAATDPRKSNEIKTGTLQAIGGKRKVTIESTAEGRTGLFYDLWTRAMLMYETGQEFSELDFYPIFLSWLEDPDCNLSTPQVITDADEEYFKKLEGLMNIKITDTQKYFYIAKKRELGDDIKQEYPSTPEEAFSAVKDGSYYIKQMNSLRERHRIVPNLYDPNLDVIVAMDLGMNDDFVLIFAQVYQGETRLIDCYSANGEGLLHYANKLFEYKQTKGYNYSSIYAPHDINVTELTTGKSRKDVFREYGVNVQPIKKSLVNDGIEAVRIMLENAWIDSSCVDLIDSLDKYSKEYDEVRNVWKNKPLHNEYSHIADAVRYLALSPSVTYAAVEEAVKTQHISSSYDNFWEVDDIDGFQI